MAWSREVKPARNSTAWKGPWRQMRRAGSVGRGYSGASAVGHRRGSLRLEGNEESSNDVGLMSLRAK